MIQTPPHRGRPKLHLAMTQLNGSPRHNDQPGNRHYAFSTPATQATYSPFRSAGLAPPTPYGGPVQFTPRRKRIPNDYRARTRIRLGRALSSRPLWFLLMLGALMLWWFNDGRDEMDLIRVGAAGFGREFFPEERTRGLRFFPATNPKIHYVGRWIATPNRLRKDGTFPGVYFDIVVKNTTTLFLSLHNAADQTSATLEAVSSKGSTSIPASTAIHVPFRPISSKGKPSPPVSLLARIDQEEYIVMPNASALVSICSKDLNVDEEHHIRIIAPMTDDHGKGILQLEGLWLNKGGKLLRVEGSHLGEEYENEDALSAENEQVGERHRTGLNDLLKNTDQYEAEPKTKNGDEIETIIVAETRKKVLEIITDAPGSFLSQHKGSRTGGANGLLAGVMGWEYLLGEMFGADHVDVGVDGMCLIQNCIGGVGHPSGIGDVFFRSGPFGTEHFEHPWMFDAYIPDVIVLNIGSSDLVSFDNHASEYDKSAWDLFERFENTYISLVKCIRTLAYPQHPTVVHSQEFGPRGYVSNVKPAFIPIFVMRPFRGELEHITQNVVNKLRAEGDKAVFWLDTSGWLESENESYETEDFFLDDTASPPKWRLTEQGNQRVAIFLHMHVCRYLAGEEEKCAFLPHEVYQGKVFDPQDADFDRFLENEKERKLKKLFWEEDTRSSTVALL